MKKSNLTLKKKLTVVALSLLVGLGAFGVKRYLDKLPKLKVGGMLNF